mmetsp:Transcript_11770/g.15162  ORF Transcript_11770/g.15162 Transcript_11770/m.15162 type:complete len:114 (+) Transcript_11770:867-1208(+)
MLNPFGAKGLTAGAGGGTGAVTFGLKAGKVDCTCGNEKTGGAGGGPAAPKPNEKGCGAGAEAGAGAGFSGCLTDTFLAPLSFTFALSFFIGDVPPTVNLVKGIAAGGTPVGGD